MTIYVDIHAIQSFSAHNLNRDDTGAPKSLAYGGVRRARISSQCQKSSIRDAFRAKVNAGAPPDVVATRTKRVPELIADRIAELDPSTKISATAVKAVFSAMKSQKGKQREAKKNENSKKAENPALGALFNISDQQVTDVASLIIEETRNGKKPEDLVKEVKAILNRNLSLDQGLFGRFFADSSDLTVEAAAQVAHALGTGRMPEELDYYTGRDELGALSGNDDDDEDSDNDSGSGAAMLGHKPFTSGPLYRFATVSVTALSERLGGEVDRTVAGVVEFVNSFVTTIPSGSQTAFAAHELPTTVVVTVRDDNPVSFAAAFESPVDTAVMATEALVAHANAVHETYGNHPLESFHYSVAPASADDLTGSSKVTAPELGDRLRKALENRVK